MVICDLHTDTASRIGRGVDLLRKTKGPVDLIKLQEGKIRIVVFACWVSPRYKEPFAKAMEMIEDIWQLAERGHRELVIVKKFSDLNLKKINGIIGVEGGHIFERDTKLVDALYRAGVRIFTLTWDNSNSLASSALSNDNCGLTKRGRRFISRIESLGGIIDLSHASTKTVVDCSRIVAKPIIASHSCLRSLNPCLRNISDRAIRAIVDCDGVIGINVSRRHLGRSSFAEHTHYLLNKFSPRTPAFGSDFDGIRDPIIPDCTKVKDLLLSLNGKGVAKTTINAMASKNFLRVLRQCVS